MWMKYTMISYLLQTIKLIKTKKSNIKLGGIKMSFKLSSKTKELLSKRIGIPYEKLIRMDDEEIEAYIEKKTGKKITWPKGAKVDGLPIKTLEEVDKEIDSWGR